MTSPPPREIMVDTAEALGEACAHLAAAGRFGFDTEFIGETTFHPELCLIQVATHERLMLIDPQRVGSLEPFWKVVTNPDHEVIVHGGREEIRLCHLATGRTPPRCFDVQIAAGMAGLAYPLNHAALVGQVLGVAVRKSETLTDWRTRPLTPEQVRYAYDDVRYLLRTWDSLQQRLHRMQRLEWVREEIHRFVHRATDEETALERWRKLPGIGNLPPRLLAQVRALYLWRQERAEAADRPARSLVRDDLLVEIVRRHPKSPQDLAVVRGLAKRDQEPIFATLERARHEPPESWPRPIEREQDPPQLGVLLDLLKAVVAHLAYQMKLAQALICTVADLKALIRAELQGEALDLVATPLNEGWRRQHIRPVLEGFLRGQHALRISRPTHPAPLEFRPGWPETTPGPGADALP